MGDTKECEGCIARINQPIWEHFNCTFHRQCCTKDGWSPTICKRCWIQEASLERWAKNPKENLGKIKAFRREMIDMLIAMQNKVRDQTGNLFWSFETQAIQFMEGCPGLNTSEYLRKDRKIDPRIFGIISQISSGLQMPNISSDNGISDPRLSGSKNRGNNGVMYAMDQVAGPSRDQHPPQWQPKASKDLSLQQRADKK